MGLAGTIDFTLAGWDGVGERLVYKGKEEGGSIRTEAWSTKKSEDQDCLWFSVHGCVIDSDLL